MKLVAMTLNILEKIGPFLIFNHPFNYNLNRAFNHENNETNNAILHIKFLHLLVRSQKLNLQ